MNETTNKTKVDEPIEILGSVEDLHIINDMYLSAINPVTYRPYFWEMEHKLAEI